MDTALEVLIKRDRLVVVAALAVVIALSWGYVLAGAGMGTSALEMTRMSLAGMAGGAAMTTPAVWTLGYVVLMFSMWWIMMLAMMLPSAAPMILLFAAINRKQRESGNSHVSTGVFVAGYLAAWAGFSLVATMLQWGLERTGVLSPMLVGNSAVFGGILLLAAGVYQFTPIKHACLRHCRAPVAFLSTHWRHRGSGAIRMGLAHGAFCIGCCWLLMALLFVGGVMNLYWIGGLALFVLLEKVAPAGHWLGYGTGAGLVVWGAAMLAGTY